MWKNNYTIIRWFTIVEMVDVDTGELIDKNTCKKKYNIINTKVEYENNGNSKIKKILKECKHRGQTELEFY